MSMRQYVSGELQRDVARMIDGTRTVGEIASEIGCTLHYVRTVAKNLGLTSRLSLVAKPKPVKVAMTIELDPAIAKWLRSNVPVGGDLSDLIKGIVVDAYAEENGLLIMPGMTVV